jgi:hypothetical protein
MGASTEMAEVPQGNDGDITPAGSKAESVNMDLYINPAAERKMMLKFDVSCRRVYLPRRSPFLLLDIETSTTLFPDV